MSFTKRNGTAGKNRRIILMRHAKSAWDDAGLSDFDRPLAPRGQRAATLMGAWLKERNILPGLVLCSASRRTVETWERVSNVLRMTIPVKFERDIYLKSDRVLLEQLRRLDDGVTSVMMVGHHSGIDMLAVKIAGTGPNEVLRRMRAKFPTAAVAVIDLKLKSWAELGEGTGKLVEFVVPKELV